MSDPTRHCRHEIEKRIDQYAANPHSEMTKMIIDGKVHDVPPEHMILHGCERVGAPGIAA
ncbi:MAG: hypothetical protein ACLQIQ_13630 [Beijerinckiaceae bacterium]